MRRMGTFGALALIMAASGAFLVLLRVTETFGRGSIFCSSTSCFVESLQWSLPSYAALLALVITTALMAAVLVRERVGPSLVRIATLLAAAAGAIGHVVATVVSLDFAWYGAFSGELSGPTTQLLPPILLTFAPSLWSVSLMLTGVSIALMSLSLLSLRAPLPLVILGWGSGVALAAYVPSMTLWRQSDAYAQVLTAELMAVTVWALLLGVGLRRSPRPQPSKAL
jgi:hypothetical protein